MRPIDDPVFRGDPAFDAPANPGPCRGWWVDVEGARHLWARHLWGRSFQWAYGALLLEHCIRPGCDLYRRARSQG